MALQISANTKLTVGEVEVANLVSIPAIETTKATVEVTNLSDTQRKYVNGLIEVPEALDFTCYYDKEEYQKLHALTGEQAIVITLMDGVTISFPGEVSVSMGEITVGEVPQFTLKVTVGGDIEFNFGA